MSSAASSKHSMAYPAVSPSSNVLSKVQFFLRKNGRAVFATCAFLFFVFAMSSDSVHDPVIGNDVKSTSSRSVTTVNKSSYLRNPFKSAQLSATIVDGITFNTFAGAAHSGYFSTEGATLDENTFRFAAVTDLDQLSYVRESSPQKPTFYSELLPGVLHREPRSNKYTINFEEKRILVGKHNEAGRGMELSELTLFDNRLLTFDDRTGTVYEILNEQNGAASQVVPRLVITEGDGDTDKGMKWEWSTVKGELLYIGSMGKEYTNPDGSVANTNNMWISIVNKHGEIVRKEWSDSYNFVRDKLGANYPGYIIIEAVLWSEHLKKWLFLPRRVSTTAYDENEDEHRGSNLLAIVDEHFTSADIVEIKMQTLDNLHGFSTVAFVPGTNDEHAIAVRTVEENCVGGDENACHQRSYFVVFNVLTGEVLMEEVELPDKMKFEGIEFVDIFTSEPLQPKV
mmetsp:Transcript_49089/g.59221  ORF Transcript_49089/g.59221 Transcript_49089/m.59221 type:complete len:454 (-) Transcript_49089:225-1586(-)